VLKITSATILQLWLKSNSALSCSYFWRLLPPVIPLYSERCVTAATFHFSFWLRAEAVYFLRVSAMSHDFTSGTVMACLNKP
jgi:hypothetical protein